MSDSKPQAVNDASFESEVIQAKGIVVVDFWAPWCGPCLHMAPALESFAENNAGKVKVCKVDVDENQQVAMKYGIRSIPTLIFFKNGEAVEVSIGAVSESILQSKLDALKEG